MKVEAEVGPGTGDPWAVGPVGSTLQSYHPTTGPIPWVLGAAPFLIPACWFLSLALRHRRDPDAILGLVFAAPLLAIVIAIAVFAVRHLTFHFYVCEAGFYCDRIRTRRVFPWKRICKVNEHVVHHYRSFKDLKAGESYRSQDGWFEVMNTEYVWFRFNRHSGPWARPLEAALRKASADFGFPWNVQEHQSVDD